MQVPGLLRINSDDGMFDHWLDRATEVFNRMLSKAATIPRNYIIDQSNVYLNSRKRKLKPFANCRKVAIYLFVCWILEDILPRLGNIIS